jgi:hypothetical protein
MLATIAIAKPAAECKSRRGFILLPNDDDREWAADHSRRLYRVRPSVVSDHSAFACGALDLHNTITIIRLADGKKWLFHKSCRELPHKFVDRDEYAEARLNIAERNAQALGLR